MVDGTLEDAWHINKLKTIYMDILKKEIREEDVKSIEILLAILDSSTSLSNSIMQQAADAKISIENIKNNINNKAND